jgi:hypothetical protein
MAVAVEAQGLVEGPVPGVGALMVVEAEEEGEFLRALKLSRNSSWRDQVAGSASRVMPMAPAKGTGVWKDCARNLR